MNIWLKKGLLAIAVVGIIGINGCITGGSSSSSMGQNARLDLGEPDAEERHNVEARDAQIVSDIYPDRWIMAVRASSFQDGHEPYHVIDGDEETDWRVAEGPTDPLPNEHWIELEFNRRVNLSGLSINWLGDETYKFQIYSKPFSDGFRFLDRGEGNVQTNGLETYQVGRVPTRTIRIKFDSRGDNRGRGMEEVRIDGHSYPEAYPLAAYQDAPVVEYERPHYWRGPGRYLSLLTWTQFNLKRPLADGRSGRRIMSTDSFEGGYIDFDIAVDPEKQNWITLKVWESHAELMTERGNSIALEAFIDDPDRNRRWFMPKLMTDTQNLNHEWYGKKPRPGRWVYYHYKLHEDVVGEQSRIRLRLQGIGNDRRDHPMRGSAPPVYNIISHTEPFWGLADLK